MVALNVRGGTIFKMFLSPQGQPACCACGFVMHSILYFPENLVKYPFIQEYKWDLGKH